MNAHERVLRLAMASVAKRKLINYEGSSERWRRIAVPRATIGRIVHYRVSEADTVPVGSTANAGEYAPAMVVGTYGDFEKVAQSVDLQVFVGPGSIFVKETVEGSVPGTWCWPPKQ